MAVVFMKIGQDVHITGEDWPMLSMKAYVRDMNRGYLRKSVVGDPIERINTKGQTRRLSFTVKIVDGEQIDITVAPKGIWKREYEPCVHVKSLQTVWKG